MPAQDSPAAILAAFPDDPAGSMYDLVYDGKGQGWTVTPAATMPEQVDVEAPDAAPDATPDAPLPDATPDAAVTDADPGDSVVQDGFDI